MNDYRKEVEIGIGKMIDEAEKGSKISLNQNVKKILREISVVMYWKGCEDGFKMMEKSVEELRKQLIK